MRNAEHILSCHLVTKQYNHMTRYETKRRNNFNNSYIYLFQISAVMPDDPFVFVGETLNLTCYYEETEVHRFTDVHFTRHNNERMPEKYLHRTNFRQVTLRYPVTSISDFGNYVCKVNKTLSRDLVVVNNQQVRVDCKYNT